MSRRGPAAGFRPPRSLFAVGAIVLCLVASIAAVLVISRDDPAREVAEERAGIRTASGGVESLDPGPLSRRGSPAVVWTGREVVVWGGHIEAFNMGLPGRDRVFTDGAAYDPSGRHWRSMSTSPLPATAYAPVGVWTESELVLFRGQATAAWDPEDDEWRVLPDAPGDPVTRAVWTGREILILPGMAALDLAAGTWRDLPEPPVEFSDLGQSIARWTGDELLIVGRPEPSTGFAADAVGARYDPATNEWKELPPSGLNAQAIDGDWNGRELVVVNYDMSAAGYEPATDSWHTLPAAPARFSEWYPTVASTPSQTAVFMAQAITVRGEDTNWTPLPYGAAPGRSFQRVARPVAADGILYGFGFDYETGENSFAGLDPAEMARTPTRLQVGLVSLTLPARAELQDASFERVERVEGLPPPETVKVALKGEFSSCTVSSTYVGTFGELALDISTGGASNPVTIVPADGSPAWQWRTGADPDRSVVHLVSSDLIEVACDAPGQAQDLAPYVSPPEFRGA